MHPCVDCRIFYQVAKRKTCLFICFVLQLFSLFYVMLHWVLPAVQKGGSQEYKWRWLGTVRLRHHFLHTLTSHQTWAEAWWVGTLFLPQSCLLMVSGGIMESILLNWQLLYLKVRTFRLNSYLNVTCALYGFSVALLVSVGIFALSSLLIGLLCFLTALTVGLWVCGNIFGCRWVLKRFLRLLLHLGPWWFGGTSVKDEFRIDCAPSLWNEEQNCVHQRWQTYSTFTEDDETLLSSFCFFLGINLLSSSTYIENNHKLKQNFPVCAAAAFHITHI